MADTHDWTYKSEEPPQDRAAHDYWLAAIAVGSDPLFFALVHSDVGAAGLAAFLRIKPEHGTIEIGHIQFGRGLKRTRAGTEAMLLMMRHVFGLGYRRLEWKCDSLNAPSRAAAVRYGFGYEGTFRNAMVVKGRSRDTAWYAMTDDDWPARQSRFERWLDDTNFDAAGRQIRSLRAIAIEGGTPRVGLVTAKVSEPNPESG